MNVGLVNMRRNLPRLAHSRHMYIHAFRQYVTELLDNSQTSKWQNVIMEQSDYMKKKILWLGDVARPFAIREIFHIAIW